ncbi:invasion associated locus B family protein [Limibacillus halophilus]|uniref:Invasion protein IalB n=1 Tax=Limibacillus halophilus TaxID=1579333 RepID=A0A839SU95_9PROT|nr:invasion associated locus B family protein [Limibacillus halophilus]MBB3066361.1 invasion protein IalB [Limibacillus halophilus]
MQITSTSAAKGNHGCLVDRMTARSLLGAALGLLILGFSTENASAQAVEQLGSFQQWTAYTYESGGQKICFMSATPAKAEGNYTRRGNISAMVTHRPARETRDVVSIEAGYTYQDGSDVTVTVENRSFALFTQEGNAWARDSETDKAMVTAMKAGLDMVVQGVSSRGTKTKDTYSLKGFTAAYDAISKACP